MQISGKPQLNRQINASLALGLIQQEGPLSRADLVKRTGLRATSVSAIVEHLIERGLIVETGRGVSTGGRQPIMLELNPVGRYAAGIEIAEDALNGVIVDLSGRAIATGRNGLGDTKPETVVKKSRALLDGLCKRAKVDLRKLAGVGVAVPGIVSRDEGSVLLSRPLAWQNVKLRDMLQEVTGLGVHVLNNATAGALAEFSADPKQHVRSLLYILVYLRPVRQKDIASFGCGIVLDGRPYLGEGHMAGEIRVDIEHPLAGAAKISGAPTDFDSLLAASRNDRGPVRTLWKKFAEHLGGIISHGMDFLNPGRVVIGTDTPELEKLIGSQVIEFARQHTVTGLVSSARLPIRFSPLQTDTLARGAIMPHLHELSLTPLLHDSVLG
jgi:predicted NBD/HSP70 family sugar kinase